MGYPGGFEFTYYDVSFLWMPTRAEQGHRKFRLRAWFHSLTIGKQLQAWRMSWGVKHRALNGCSRTECLSHNISFSFRYSFSTGATCGTGSRCDCLFIDRPVQLGRMIRLHLIFESFFSHVVDQNSVGSKANLAHWSSRRIKLFAEVELLLSSEEG